LIRFIRGIDHVQIAIPKNEEDAARKFYIEQLGFHEIEKPENQKRMAASGCRPVYINYI
jgi:catechol 2,3-dioxygenase-like lactoylglutathione lyase family enzyme